VPFRLQIHNEVDSTQDCARIAAQNGEPEGLCILAMRQRCGRGRLGRTWIAPPGKNLSISIVLYPRIVPHLAGLIGLGASIAVCESLNELANLNAKLKWPNDVLISNKKIAGILSEASIAVGKINYIILGIGLNLNSTMEDFPPELHGQATSLFMETGKIFDTIFAAEVILEHFNGIYTQVIQQGPEFIKELWMTRWQHKGKQVEVNGIRGTGKELGDDGALIIETDGKFQRITSGEVTIL
jgi:BirA family transcriptional regulator, biotin operon repressor / biotin---[acetyl-CoA-carboxylase] ligase